MVYAIMLNDHQDSDRPDEYRVSVSGSLEYCQSARRIPDSLDTWWRKDYSSCDRVEDHQLGGLEGAIFKLVEAEREIGTSNGGGRWPIAALASGTFFAGLAVGTILNQSLPLRGQEDKR